MPALKVGLLLYPGCIPTGLFAFSDLLLAANRRLGETRFRPVWLSADGATIETANGPELSGQPLQQAEIDSLVVPGAWRSADQVPAPGDDGLASAIGALDAPVRLWSYCTGVCLVAQAGKLDGRKATTTWWLAGRVGELYPNVDWALTETAVFGQHATASGVNGHLPLALGMIEEACGPAVVADIRAAMVLPRPGEQHTPFQTLTFLLQQGPLMRRIAAWVERTPARALNTTSLAEHLNLSPRTLARRVTAATGEPCGQLMRLIKLNQVSDRLLTTTLPLGSISDDLGYADTTGLRRAFKRATGLTPAEYRRRFGQ